MFHCTEVLALTFAMCAQRSVPAFIMHEASLAGFHANTCTYFTVRGFVLYALSPAFRGVIKYFTVFFVLRALSPVFRGVIKHFTLFFGFVWFLSCISLFCVVCPQCFEVLLSISLFALWFCVVCLQCTFRVLSRIQNL